MGKLTKTKIILAKGLASAGVDYSHRTGAICPECGERTKIRNTFPWEDRVRVRYHRCVNESCILCVLGITIKSIEVDAVPAEQNVEAGQCMRSTKG